MLMTIKMNSPLLTMRKLSSMKIKFESNNDQKVGDEQEKEVLVDSDDDTDTGSDEEDLKEVIQLEDDSDDS